MRIHLGEEVGHAQAASARRDLVGAHGIRAPSLRIVRGGGREGAEEGVDRSKREKGKWERAVSATQSNAPRSSPAGALGAHRTRDPPSITQANARTAPNPLTPDARVTGRQDKELPLSTDRHRP